MYCKNCGAKIANDAKFCNQCGVLAGNGDAFCPACGREVPMGSMYCQNCGEPLNGGEEVVLKKVDAESISPTQARDFAEKENQTPDFFKDVEVPTQNPYNYSNNYANNYSAPASKYPMKWYKFLLVLFVLSGIANILVGFSTMTGAQYVESGISYAEYVYDWYPGLKVIDVIYGLYAIAMGVYVFMVRSALKGFKRSAPKMVTILYVVSLVSFLIYNIISASIIGMGIANLMAELTLQVVVNLAMIFINKAYFKTRQELFIN